MTYELFNQLYSEALEYSDVDMYIAERGWQDWMESFENHGDILKDIYFLANSSLKEIRESRGYSRLAFSKAYNIPIRTLEDWESEKRTAPIYVTISIAYTFFASNLDAKLDLTNQIFGHLKALYPTEKRDKSGAIYWHCECLRCGKQVDVVGSSLKKGNTKSCGCLSGTNTMERNREIVNQFGGTNPSQLKSKTPENNSTGIKGVSKYYSHGKFKGYRAYITFKGKTKHIGVFKTLDEATEKRKEAEEKYFKPILEKAQKNKPTS